tara:strand:+ start:308 stop:1027 length:720 start_codon:yes stop_codon:yes gene_type:complete
MKNEKIDRTIFRPRINNVINILESQGIELNKLSALEMFGRDGTAHVMAYADKVRALEVWEIDRKWEVKLKNNLPNAEIKIIDSVNEINNGVNLPKFDLIMIDNTIPMFGPENEQEKYCEHFDFIKNIGRIMEENTIIVFNVNKQPFNYDNQLKWKKRREEFYGAVDTSNLSIEFLLNFYKELFLSLNLATIFCDIVLRHSPHLDYLIFNLRKIREKTEADLKNIDWISLYPYVKRKNLL